MKIPMFRAITTDNVVPIAVGPGCFRWDLPSAPGARAWIVELEPGAVWPYEDVHDAGGEQVLVVSGELIEGTHRFGAGTYILYGPHTRHQPRTKIGVRLFGMNVYATD